MKRIFYILGNVDRKIIFLIIGLSVLIPLLKPNWIKLPIKITNNTQIVFDEINHLEENNRILLSFEYGASTKPEIHPMAIALLNQLFLSQPSQFRLPIKYIYQKHTQLKKDVMALKMLKLFRMKVHNGYP